MNVQNTPKTDAAPATGAVVGSDGAAGQSRNDHSLSPTERSLEMLRQLNSMFNEWEGIRSDVARATGGV
ncbi:MAG: hypothetical protein IT428_07145 [Planctomycetaceae bacterium]|nr:hypothetical protein [Planctomycetaceae bacterium]